MYIIIGIYNLWYDLLIQTVSFTKKGLSTAYVAFEQEDKEVLQRVMDGAYKLVFFTPEMLLQRKKWRTLLKSPVYSNGLRGVVVDEVHTVKKW